MSTRDIEKLEKRAENKLSNMWGATLAFIRPRNVRWLGLLKDLKGDSRKLLVVKLTLVYNFLLSELSQNNNYRNNILYQYPDFKPKEHYAEIIRGKDGKEKKRIMVRKSAVPDNLNYVRHMWHVSQRVRDDILGEIEAIEVFADELFNLTGTALIHQMQDFTDGADLHAIDPAISDALATEAWESPDYGEPEREVATAQPQAAGATA